MQKQYTDRVLILMLIFLWPIIEGHPREGDVGRLVGWLAWSIRALREGSGVP